MITWTKTWSPADDGSILRGADLRNLQADINTGAVSVGTIPTVGDIIYWTGLAWAAKSAAVTYVFCDNELVAWENDAVTVV